MIYTKRRQAESKDENIHKDINKDINKKHQIFLDKAAEIAGDKEFFLAKAKREESKQKKLDQTLYI